MKKLFKRFWCVTHGGHFRPDDMDPNENGYHCAWCGFYVWFGELDGM